MAAPLNNRAGEGKDAVHNAGREGDEGNAEDHGQQQLETAGNVVLIQSEFISIFR